MSEPETKETVMANKTVRKEGRKKQTRTLKEKRAAKKAKTVAKSEPFFPPTGR